MDRPVAADASPYQLRRTPLQAVKDLAITLCLWVYFTAGFVVFFAPFYLLAIGFSRQRQSVYQRLNSYFYRGFFLLCRLMVPRHKWEIDPGVRDIRSAVIVCNHVSYLDSILLVSLYSRHTTIAKDRLFAIPILGGIIRRSGYLPSSGRGRFADLLLDSLQTVTGILEQGGNVIVFPEGTRSRGRRVGDLQKGVFKIAKYCKAPIKVLKISNTDKLFQPGKFLFYTCIDNTIGLRQVAELTPDYDNDRFAINDLVQEVHALLCEKIVK